MYLGDATVPQNCLNELMNIEIDLEVQDGIDNDLMTSPGEEGFDSEEETNIDTFIHPSFPTVEEFLHIKVEASDKSILPISFLNTDEELLTIDSPLEENIIGMQIFNTSGSTFLLHNLMSLYILGEVG